MKTSKRAVQFIKDHEGLKLKAYRCPTGHWTIGYGHTSDATYPVKSGMKITQAEAEQYLEHDIMEVERVLDKASKASLNGNQYGALVSLGFNIGVDALVRSSVMKAINKGKKNVTWEFGLWVKGRDPKTGKLKTLPGLVRRRAEEAALYLTPAALEDKVVTHPDIDEPTEETTDARNSKKGVTQAKDPTKNGLWSLLAGGLMAIIAPILQAYSQLKELTGDVPYLAPALSLAVVAAIGYAIYSYMKDGGQVDLSPGEGEVP